MSLHGLTSLKRLTHIWLKIDSKRPGGQGGTSEPESEPEGEQELIASHHKMGAWGALRRRARELSS